MNNEQIPVKIGDNMIIMIPKQHMNDLLPQIIAKSTETKLLPSQRGIKVFDVLVRDLKTKKVTDLKLNSNMENLEQILLHVDTLRYGVELRAWSVYAKK